MSELLKHWASIELGSLNEFVSKTIDPSKFPEEIFELYSVPSFPSGRPEIVKGSEIGSTKQEVGPNDVLVCKINPRINRVWRVGQHRDVRKIASSEWIVVRSEYCHAGFLRHYFSSPHFRDFLCDDVTGVGGSLTRAQPKRVSKSLLPLAPLNEQNRIADKLDALLARVDVCRERLYRIPNILKRLRRSILAAACSGELTREWRSTHELQDQWETGKLDAVIAGKPRNGYSPRAVEFETPVKSLTLSATTTGRLLLQHYKYIDEAIPSDSHLWLQDDDILIQRANTLEYVGVSVLFRGPAKTYVYPDLMMKCRVNDRVIPQFLNYVLLSAPVREYFRANATGTAGNMPKINQQTVMNAPVSWPSIAEQQEIVARVERLFAFADQVEARLTVAQTRVNRLTPSSLSKAFRGELVPQDPNDEPAEELLKRIRRAKTSEVLKPKEKKSGKRVSKQKAATGMLNRSEIQSNHLTDILRSHGSLTAEALWAASQLAIDDFYDQLKEEEEKGLLREARAGSNQESRMLELQ